MRTFPKALDLKRISLAGAAFAGMLALAAPAAAQFGGPPQPPNTGVPVFTTLTGGNALGQFTGVVDPPKGTFCYLLNVSGIAPATAAHVHVGGPGDNGAPVITLAAPTDGASGGCQPIAADLAEKLLANPAGYYVNVHNAAFPGGVIRGQLSK
jgi:hypothetical protein